jgi:FtsP/CotA-like multicopper oxidase with cupredoxin domain
LLALAAAAAFGALAADNPEKVFNLSIVRSAVEPQQRLIRVQKGDVVRLRVTSDVPGELHLHGYRLEAKVAPGSPSELAFRAYATGRYPLEWHAAGDAGNSRSPHGPALATLEVRPD